VTAAAAAGGRDIAARITMGINHSGPGQSDVLF